MGSNDYKGLAAIIAFPLILVHGYSDDSSSWDTWLGWLEDSNITKVHSINFKDSCGTVKEHAAELLPIINVTGSDKVNIVAYSKGGLDARMFISENPGKVANLIMLGTPNKGTPAAYMDVTDCAGSGGLGDLWPNSEATKSKDQNSTHYYVLAGNYSNPCSILMVWWECHTTKNDGFVPVESALSNYASLGEYPVNHSSLLQNKDIYQKVLEIIVKENSTYSVASR